MHKLSKKLRDHYSRKYLRYGATSQGVDWGKDEKLAHLRQLKMLNLLLENQSKVSLLDVGCGYGHLAKLINEDKLCINYSGIDVVGNMIADARHNFPQYNFYLEDFLDHECANYDYLICNGVLTQKLSASTLEMNEFFRAFVKKMYSHANIGIAFNLMSTYVNFQRENLYYRNPSETLAWCTAELSQHVILNAACEPWFEYTVYVYKPNVIRS